ncbi:19819_t:CDS:2, partial [Cetraspora pellucida]
NSIEFNKELKDKTEIERLRDFWFSEITKSKLENDDKQKLNELREECIRELEQTQPGTNDFNYIRDGIQQKVALNIQRNKKLKALSNEKYDKINKEIPKIETANLYNTLLYDVIENEMKEDNNKQSFEDGEKYDLLIQTLEEPFLDSLHTVNQLQELRKQLFSE